MKTVKHGLSIGIYRTGLNGEFFVSLKAQGKLTHEDFDIIVPMIDSALEGVKSPKIRVLIDATEMEGWEPRAAWDDFKFGLKHRSELFKVAIYGTKGWQKRIAKIADWFLATKISHFDNEQEAVTWLNED